jgi:type II secretory pathway pseudopilin PulG
MTRMFFCALSRSCSHGSVSRAFCRLPANHANKREKEFRKQESVFSVDIYSRQFACLAGSVAVAPGPSSSEGRFTLARQRDPESIRGFTLAELLIATGVTAGIVLMLGWMLGALMSTASHANARVDSFRDARAAMQMIERDLRNLVPTQWNIQTNPVGPTPTPSVTRPAAYFTVANVWQDPNDPYSTTNPNAQLFALIANRTSPTSGDVCAVGYYCRWDTQLHAYSLRRFFNNSTATLNVLASPSVTAANYASASPSPSPALYGPSANDEVLAAYVWNFRVTMYNGAGAVITTYPYICDPSGTYNPTGTPPTPNPRPAAIEISFNAMSPQAARTVMSVSSDPSVWMNMDVNLVKPHAYEFRSRINLP